MHGDLVNLKVFFLHTESVIVAFIFLLSIDVAKTNQSAEKFMENREKIQVSIKLNLQLQTVYKIRHTMASAYNISIRHKRASTSIGNSPGS